METVIRCTTVEALASGGYQLVLPVGTWETDKYGRMTFTREYLDKIVQNYRDKVLGNREPFIDTDHDNAAANGWIKDVVADDDGLKIKIEWTERGKELLEAGLYKYFSVHIEEGKKNLATGKDIDGPVLIAVALTNVPVFNVLPPAHLSDHRPDAPASDKPPTAARPDVRSTDTMTRGSTMDAIIDALKNATPEDLALVVAGIGVDGLLAMIAGLSDEDKAKVAEALGAPAEEAPAEEAKDKPAPAAVAASNRMIETLAEEVADLRKQLASVRRDDIIKAAVEDGRILPAHRARWEKFYTDNPKLTEQIVKALPKVVQLDTVGHSRDVEPEAVIEPKAEKLMSSLGMNADEIKAAKTKKE